jgi:hypothetical protein
MSMKDEIIDLIVSEQFIGFINNEIVNSSGAWIKFEHGLSSRS